MATKSEEMVEVAKWSVSISPEDGRFGPNLAQAFAIDCKRLNSGDFELVLRKRGGVMESDLHTVYDIKAGTSRKKTPWD